MIGAWACQGSRPAYRSGRVFNSQGKSVHCVIDRGRVMAAQPWLARGSVLLGTLKGDLICLRTGREDADGWYRWGGNAQHNKTS